MKTNHVEENQQKLHSSMLKLYEKYLEVIDKYIETCFEAQKPFIHCGAGCCNCCETGEYPFSRLEMEYLMSGFPDLTFEEQQTIKTNIKILLAEKGQSTGRFLHKCPFLLNGRCVMYKRRGITCRVYGLASFETVKGKQVIKLPECSKYGLNYSEVVENGTVSLEKFQSCGVEAPIRHSLSLNYFEREILRGVTELEFGEIRPLLEWFR